MVHIQIFSIESSDFESRFKDCVFPLFFPRCQARRSKTNMAKKGSEFAAFVGNEIECPVCLEIYDDPKCLPTCAHNVCLKCLGNIVRRSPRKTKVQCPECRKKSQIPPSGVAGFPTNHLLKRLVENSPVKKERRAFGEALQQWREQMNEISKDFDKLKEVHAHVVEEAKRKMKDQIKSEAKRLAKSIEAEEKKLLSQVDARFKETASKSPFELKSTEVKKLCTKVSTSLENAEKIKDENDFKEFQRSKSTFEKQCQESFHTLNAEVAKLRSLHGVSDVKFLPGKVDKSGKMLGELSCNKPSEAKPLPAGNLPKTGHVIRHIDTEFVPTAVAVSPVSGEIAVLDGENKCVHIFTSAGDPHKQFDVKYGNLKEIAYSRNNDIVVLNQEKNRLLHFDKDGAFIRKFIQAPNASVRFQKMAIDVEGRYVLTSLSDPSGPGVIVYDSERSQKWAFTSDHFKDKKLLAIHHNDNIFVSDGTSTIKVFDHKGKLLREMKNLGDNNAGLVSIALDAIHDSLVCGSDKNSILVVKPDGRVISTFPMGGSLNAIALCKGCDSLVACFHEKKFIQILSHRE